MRRKSKRHKLIAVQFLSNISLDGSSHSRKLGTFSASHEQFDAHVHYQTGAYSGGPISHSFRLGPKGLTRENAEAVAVLGKTDFSGRPNLFSSTVFDPSQSNGHFDRDDSHAADSAQWTHRFPSQSADQYTPSLSTPLTIHAPPHPVRCDIHTSSTLRPILQSHTLSSSSSKRFAICSTGFRRSVLAVFSILSNSRKISTSSCRPIPKFVKPASLNMRFMNDGGDAMGRSNVFLGSSPRGSLEPFDRGQAPSDLDTVPCLSSLPPTNDEVLSLARMLHLHPSSLRTNGPVARVYGPGGLEPDLVATLGPDLTLFLSTINNRTGSLSNVNRPATTLGYVHSQRAHVWSPALNTQGSYWPRTRRRHSSSTSGGGASLTSLTSSAVCYPDPLFYYSPHLLDDPELLVATGRRYFPLSSYLVSVLSYVRPNEQKRNVNREFHERFPTIQLTLTKLRSIKSVLVQIVVRLSFDLWIAAQSHVLFEKLLLKLFVNKSNRRLCASAALLISAKLNDIKGSDLTNLIQELETTFRISRRDLFHAEVEVTLGLEFCLIPTEAECIPHYFRIHKLLDLTPPYPISARLGQTGSVHSLHNEAAL